MPGKMAGHRCPHPEAFRGQGEPCAVAHPGRYVCHQCGRTHPQNKPWPHPLPKRVEPKASDRILDLAWTKSIPLAKAKAILDES